MLLFNSKRSNKGKKYLKKGSIDLVFAEEAEAYNKWFNKHRTELYNYLSIRRSYHEDAFNDAYLKIYENVLYSGIKLENYRAYFLRAYFTILQDIGVKQNRYCDLLPNYDKEDNNTEIYLEIENKARQLENDIFDYVYTRYTIHEFEIFKMYISLKPAINYDSLSEITGLYPYQIQRIVSKIRKDIRKNSDFATRWHEVA